MDNDKDIDGFGIFEDMVNPSDGENIIPMDLLKPPIKENNPDVPSETEEHKVNNSFYINPNMQDEITGLENDPELTAKFNEIARNVEIQSSINTGTQRINLNKAFSNKYNRSNREQIQECQEHQDYIDDSYDDREEKEIKPLHVILLVIAAMLFTAVCTFVLTKFNEDLTSTHNRIENQKLNTTILELKEQLSDKDTEIKELQDQGILDSEEKGQLQDNIDTLTTEKEELEKQLEDLQEKLEETEAELKEQRFRADMFQKYGPQWER